MKTEYFKFHTWFAVNVPNKNKRLKCNYNKLKERIQECLLLLVSETYHPTNSKSWFIRQWLIQKSILNQKFRDSLHLTIPSMGNTKPCVSSLFGCGIRCNISQSRNMLLGPRSNSVMYFASQFFCRDKKKVPSKQIFITYSTKLQSHMQILQSLAKYQMSKSQ